MTRVYYTFTAVDDIKRELPNASGSPMALYPIIISYDINNTCMKEVREFEKLAIEQYKNKKGASKSFPDRTYADIMITPTTLCIILHDSYTDYPKLVWTRYEGWLE